MYGTIDKTSTASAYQPPEEVKLLTQDAQKDYAIGYEILHTPYEELNNRSVIERMNLDRRTFNTFVSEGDADPRDAWKWRGTRSMARNKIIATHAQLTSSYTVPKIYAQNDQDEDDQDMGNAMRDIVAWMVDNSNYKQSFLLATMGALVNPVTFLEADYNEIMQTIREKGEDGSLTKKEVLDEVMSGFQANVYSANQVLITNAYEQNIQKQRKVFKRRYIDYEEFKAKYKDHPNFDYVTPGVKCLYNDEDGLFYDIRDEENMNLVEEVTEFCRREDLQVVYVNGVYFGESDVENNAFKHRDNRNTPKINIIPFGYQRINEHFFYFRSAAFNLSWDNNLIDAMYENVMNISTLDLHMPMAVTGAGDEKIDSEVVFPGSVVTFGSAETKVQPLLPRSNLSSGFNAMREIESSMAESSVSETTQGQLPQASQKAYNVARAETNAKIQLASSAKSIAQSVADFGALMIDIATQHLTVAEAEEITGGAVKLKYRTFLLNDQIVDGKKVSKIVRFSDYLTGRNLDEDERKEMEWKLFEEEGEMEGLKRLFVVNPFLFSRMKYLIRIEAEDLVPKNENFERVMKLEDFKLGLNNPYINQENWTKDFFLGTVAKGEEDKYAKKVDDIMGQMMNPKTAGTSSRVPGMLNEANQQSAMTTKMAGQAMM